jgi:hypothetical protein
MDRQTLKLIVDEVFTVAEKALSTHPLLVLALQGVNTVVDAEIDQILANLKRRGIV